MKMLNAMAAENINSIAEYLGWVLGSGRAILPRVLRLYGGMVRRIMAKSGVPDHAAEQVVRAEHERRVAEMDERFALAPGTAATVHALRSTQVMRSRMAAARFLALDLFAMGGLLIGSIVYVLIAYPARIGLLAGVVAVAVVAGILYVGALRFRKILEYQHLARIAQRLAEMFRVKHVVLGHSHEAQVVPLADGADYINVGTWVPAGTDAYFVYFVLSGEGDDRRGRLWRWLQREQRPEPFEQKKR